MPLYTCYLVNLIWQGWQGLSLTELQYCMENQELSYNAKCIPLLSRASAHGREFCSFISSNTNWRYSMLELCSFLITGSPQVILDSFNSILVRAAGVLSAVCGKVIRTVRSTFFPGPSDMEVGRCCSSFQNFP